MFEAILIIHLVLTGFLVATDTEEQALTEQQAVIRLMHCQPYGGVLEMAPGYVICQSGAYTEFREGK